MNIHDCCARGDLGALETMLQADPNLLNAMVEFPLPEYNRMLNLTPLFLAALAGQAATVDALVKKGAALRSQTGDDLFTWTCLCPNAAARNAMLELIFDENIRGQIHPDLPPAYKLLFNQESESPLGSALTSSNYPLSPFNVTVLADLPSALRSDQSCVVSSDFQGMNSLQLATYRVAIHRLLNLHSTIAPKKLLYLAVQLGDLEKVQNEDPSMLSAELINGMTPAYVAATYNRVSILEFLHSRNVDLSLPLISGSKRGVTPAYAAASWGHIDALRTLKQTCGVDVTLELGPGALWGRTPPFAAAFMGHTEVVKYFNEECQVNPAKPLVVGEKEGWTLVFVAAAKDRLALLNYLVEDCRLDPYQPIPNGPWKGWTPMNIAVVNKSEAVLRYFGLDDADLRLFSLFERRSLQPLQIACLAGNIRGMQTYVNINSALNPISSMDRNVWLPLDFALYHRGLRKGPVSVREQNQVRIIQLLIDNGLDRAEVIDQVRAKRPRLYNGLLSAPEQMLEELLVHKELLKDIISGRVTMPMGSEKSRTIRNEGFAPKSDMHEIVLHLEASLAHIVQKCDVTDMLLPRFSDKLEKILAAPKNLPTQEPFILSTEECRLVDKILTLLDSFIEFLDQYASNIAAAERQQAAEINTARQTGKRKSAPVGSNVVNANRAIINIDDDSEHLANDAKKGKKETAKAAPAQFISTTIEAPDFDDLR